MIETKQLGQRIRNSEKPSLGRNSGGRGGQGIKNPSGGIANGVATLRKGLMPSEQEEEYAGSMKDGLHRVQAIVRRLLERCDGHILVDGVLGRSPVCPVCLPIVPGQQTVGRFV